ncbi:hypothetical protein D3C71_1747890 [compost metagenome]
MRRHFIEFDRLRRRFKDNTLAEAVLAACITRLDKSLLDPLKVLLPYHQVDVAEIPFTDAAVQPACMHNPFGHGEIDG